MSIKHITTDELCRMRDKEGIIFQGCGGDLQEWLDGINDTLTEAGILQNGSRFQDCLAFENGELTCLLFPFENVDLSIGKLAMWRLKTRPAFGKSFACKTRQVNGAAAKLILEGQWLSDYVPNQLGGFVSSPPKMADQAAGMDIRIYQIAPERDADRLKFMGMDHLAQKDMKIVDPTI